MLILSLVVMVAGALVNALTSDLITGRARQAFAMGAIPLGIGLMRDVLPPREIGSAMVPMSSSMGVEGSLALPAAALVTHHADWHVLVYGAAGLGVLCTVPNRTEGTIDALGAIGLSAGLVLFLLPVARASDSGWTSGHRRAVRRGGRRASPVGSGGALEALTFEWPGETLVDHK
jgi:hypothetical protein